MKGMVKFFDQSKGYGFIVPDEGEKDIFVHKTGIRKDESPWQENKFATLQEGERVEFDMGSNKQGPCAVNVRILNHHG